MKMKRNLNLDLKIGKHHFMLQAVERYGFKDSL